ncbi:hypothetical protein [Blastococcus litoris]|uniref:hypothetical protein n=1 Tax=Blastococcus litoris TaxID=2171622 RepID=UPI0013DE93C7|nr:hypothetical protein [Blastococcus litoris]
MSSTGGRSTGFRPNGKGRTAAAVLAAFVGMGGLAACSDDSAGPETGTDVEDVAEEPEDGDEALADPMTGQTVTVSAEIEEVVAPSAIRIGEENLLVLSAGPTFEDMGFELVDGLVEDDVVLQVTGTVGTLVFPDIENEFGIDWDDEELVDFEGERVLVASEVDTLAGEPVTFAGEVQDVISTVSFQVAGAGWSVVVLDAQQAAVAEGEYVQVSGTIREFDIATIEEEFGLDLDDELYADFDQRFVVVAENVVSAAPVAP